MPTYPLQNPIPQSPMTLDEHRKNTNLFMIVGAIALIIGMLYWWTTASNNSSSTLSTTPQATDLRTQVAAILRASSVTVSQQEVDHVAAQLAKSKVVVSDAQKQAVAASLRAN